MLDSEMVTKAEKSEQLEVEIQPVALWVCGPCQAWWGSQGGDPQEERFLLRMAEPHTHLFKWEDYRGWRSQAAEANVCPACGASASLPRLTLLSPAAPVPTAAPVLAL